MYCFILRDIEIFTIRCKGFFLKGKQGQLEKLANFCYYSVCRANLENWNNIVSMSFVQYAKESSMLTFT